MKNHLLSETTQFINHFIEILLSSNSLKTTSDIMIRLIRWLNGPLTFLPVVKVSFASSALDLLSVCSSCSTVTTSSASSPPEAAGAVVSVEASGLGGTELTGGVTSRRDRVGAPVRDTRGSETHPTHYLEAHSGNLVDENSNTMMMILTISSKSQICTSWHSSVMTGKIVIPSLFLWKSSMFAYENWVMSS